MDENFGIIRIDADYDFDREIGDIFYCICPFCEDENVISVEYLEPISVCVHFVSFDPQDRTFLFLANPDFEEDDEFIEEDFEDDLDYF